VNESMDTERLEMQQMNPPHIAATNTPKTLF